MYILSVFFSVLIIESLQLYTYIVKYYSNDNFTMQRISVDFCIMNREKHVHNVVPIYLLYTLRKLENKLFYKFESKMYFFF